MAALTEQQKQDIRDAWVSGQYVSHRQLAKAVGVHRSTVDSVLVGLPHPAPVQAAPVLAETNEVVGDRWNIAIPKTRIQTLDELLEHADVDTSVWDVERFVVNRYEVAAKNADGDLEVEPLFQVKATLKQKKFAVDARAEIQALKEEAKAHMPLPRPVVYTTLKSDNMLELLLPDLHAAKLAYAKETGYQNYDTAIAVETYRRAIDSLVQSASAINIDRIVLGVGNDLLQADNIQGTTFSGTKVDVDSRYRKTYVTVRKMLTETIEKLRLIAPVDVKVVPGNHDTLSSFTMGDSLECRFEKYTDVLVDNEPIMHKIVDWGKVFLLLTHGHQGKQADYGLWMATQYPHLFGHSKFREVHTGHKHKTALDEKFGVRIRTFGALCSVDEWHANNNFVGNLRVAEGLVFNKHSGLTAHYYHTEVD